MLLIATIGILLERFRQYFYLTAFVQSVSLLLLFVSVVVYTRQFLINGISTRLMIISMFSVFISSTLISYIAGKYSILHQNDHTNFFFKNTENTEAIDRIEEKLMKYWRKYLKRKIINSFVYFFGTTVNNYVIVLLVATLIKQKKSATCLNQNSLNEHIESVKLNECHLKIQYASFFHYINQLKFLDKLKLVHEIGLPKVVELRFYVYSFSKGCYEWQAQEKLLCIMMVIICVSCRILWTHPR